MTKDRIKKNKTATIFFNKIINKYTICTVVFFLFVFGYYSIFFSSNNSNYDIAAETTDPNFIKEAKTYSELNNNSDTRDFTLNDIHIIYPTRIMDPLETSYPVYTNLLDVVTKWNPDNPDLPKQFKETLQHFNYSNPEEMIIATKFRNAEVPFKVYNVPEFAAISRKWDDQYLRQQFTGSVQSQHVEKSKDNHFMYWNGNIHANQIKNYKPPTEFIQNMKFESWLRIARYADETKVKNETIHYYFMANSIAGDQKRSFIARDLTLFSTRLNNFFVSNVNANKGIQCRMAMRGIIAEAHYDSGRNMVAMLKGAKRYIINPPHECKNLGLITDKRHPSYRHSVIDWSDMDQAKSRGFASVDAIDTIVQTGEVLYIPSYWFHYIVALKYSIQCNSRSGSPPDKEGQTDIEQCLGDKLDRQSLDR